MQSKPKINSIITHTLGEDGCTLTFNVKGAGSFTFDVTSAHPDNQHRAAIHGFVQRISDGAAIPRDTKTGRSATPEEKMARMQAIAAHYASGAAEWRMVAAGDGEGRSGGVSIVVRALAAIQGCSVADALAMVRERAEKARITTKAYLKRLATAKAIIDKVAELRAGEASADGDDMLAELIGGAGDDEDGEEGADEGEQS